MAVDTDRDEAAPTDYSEKIIGEILARATGAAADSNALGTVEAAVGMFERCIGSATVTPQNPITASVTPSVLMLAGRSLASKGNAVFVIEIEGGAVRLAPVAHFDISGDSDPSTHFYRCDIAGPSRQRSVRVEAAGVVHFKIGCDPARAHIGRSPLQIAVATGRLSASVEQSLTREQAFRPTRIVYSPRGNDQISDLVNDISQGGIVAESVNESDPAASSKTPASVGPEPGESQLKLRTDTARSILSAYGLSPALFESSDGAGQREAWRRAWASVFSPIVRGMAHELAVKLDTVGFDLELAELRASDSQGQGRALSARAVAVKQLVEAGVDRARALELAGFAN